MDSGATAGPFWVETMGVVGYDPGGRINTPPKFKALRYESVVKTVA